MNERWYAMTPNQKTPKKERTEQKKNNLTLKHKTTTLMLLVLALTTLSACTNNPAPESKLPELKHFPKNWVMNYDIPKDNTWLNKLPIERQEYILSKGFSGGHHRSFIHYENFNTEQVEFSISIYDPEQVGFLLTESRDNKSLHKFETNTGDDSVGYVVYSNYGPQTNIEFVKDGYWARVIVHSSETDISLAEKWARYVERNI